MQQQSRRHGLHVGWRIEIVAEDRMTDRLQVFSCNSSTCSRPSQRPRMSLFQYSRQLIVFPKQTLSLEEASVDRP